MSNISTKAATIGGTFLRPGVSKNKRLYTKENIGKAVARMNESIQSGKGLKLNMATSHAKAYEDDALSTVGIITKVWQEEDGSAKFDADILNTSRGRDIAVGAVGGALKGISIRGGWMSAPVKVEYESETVTTSSDMSVVGIDFTHRPGVEGAEVEYASFVESVEKNDPNAIFESLDDVSVLEVFEEEDPRTEEDVIREAVSDAVQTILEAADKTPYGDVKYADPGYQSDKKKRYPINTEAHVRAAWAYINVASNASAYSSSQLARVKSRIKSAAKKFGINVTEDFENLVSDMQDIIEAYVSMSIDNGAGTVNVSGYTNDAGKLHAVAMRVAATAITALTTLDPDADGDIDIPGGDTDSDVNPTKESVVDGSTCLLCSAPLVEGNLYCPMCGSPVPTAESPDSENVQTNKENAMTASNETQAEVVVETAPATAPALTAADIATIVAEAIAVSKAADAAALAEATAIADAEAAAVAEAAAIEAAKPKTYTLEETQAMIAEAAKQAVAEAAAVAVADYRGGNVTRKGVVGTSQVAAGFSLSEDDELDPAALAEMSPSDFRKVSGAAWSNQPSFRARFAKADAMVNGY